MKNDILSKQSLNDRLLNNRYWKKIFGNKLPETDDSGNTVSSITSLPSVPLNTSRTGKTAVDKTTRRVILFSQKNIESKFLADLIIDQLNLICIIFEPQQLNHCFRELSELDLLLIDNSQFETKQINTLFKKLSDDNHSVKVALFNNQNDSDLESLLKWPFIKGVFGNIDEYSQFLFGLNEILTSSYWLPRSLMHRMIEGYRDRPNRKKPNVKLTKREKQLLIKLLEGATNQMIAESLHVSEHTVKSHLYNIFKKIGVKNRLQASHWAKDNNIVDEQSDHVC